MIKRRWKTGLVQFACAATMVAGVFLAGAPRVYAEDNCQRRLVHADHELDRAVEKHDYNSRQADH